MFLSQLWKTLFRRHAMVMEREEYYTGNQRKKQILGPLKDERVTDSVIF